MKKVRKAAYIIFVFVSSSVSAQLNKNFDAFVKLFPKTGLPTTIKYSESEFQTEYYEPEETPGKESIPYHDHVRTKDSSLIIEYELVKLYLLADTEIVTPKYPDDGPDSDTIYPTYYISKRLVTDKKFLCIIYERQFILINEKYLCTIDKNGKLIDKILVASANYSGTGILTESFRVPWFPDTKSNISKDLSINLLNSLNGDLTYQVQENGKIQKVSP